VVLTHPPLHLSFRYRFAVQLFHPKKEALAPFQVTLLVLNQVGALALRPWRSM